ncbi:MAG: hypothetical protein E7323_00995 [Clostridiales bacterium]|nr:hypothetical protein [Clostridiales bacterium]
MESYKHFKLAAYVYAYYIHTATDADIQKAIDYYKHYVHLDKVYIENHRGLVDISVERLRQVKELFERNGIETSGGITSTVLVNGERKPSYYDTFCYTDPAHRERYVQIVRDIASVFDEIILDDFFFTSCTCEMCIQAKGKHSWKDYRLHMMEDFAHVIVDEAKRVNPKVNFIIKYPNWYESYQECGYNPGKQKDIFDMVYTGTETRDPQYSAQHLQRYLSYSIIRLMENTAPGRNGGGWIDPFGSTANMNFYLQQADMTMLAKAKELMLFNFSVMENTALLPALGHELIRMDQVLGKLGNPIGVAAWEPFDGDGEDQLYNYLGMGGIAVEPSPYFDETAPVVLFTESTACDPTAMNKLEAYLRRGGNAVVTTGFFRQNYDNGMKDLTSVRLTHRHVLCDEYMISHYNYRENAFCKGHEKLLFEILSYKTNATCPDVGLIAGEHTFPLMTEDSYGKGRLFILNVPENFADLYKLPREVWQGIAKHISMGQRVYMAGEGRHSFLAYDNNTYAIQSYNPMQDTVNIIVRGECKGLRNLETGAEYTERIALSLPSHMADATTVIPEPPEFSFPVPMAGGSLMFFEVIGADASGAIEDSYLHTNPYEG